MNYNCCDNCIHAFYSQFAPLGEVSCEFYQLRFVKLTDWCERYESSNDPNAEEDEDE